MKTITVKKYMNKYQKRKLTNQIAQIKAAKIKIVTLMNSKIKMYKMKQTTFNKL